MASVASTATDMTNMTSLTVLRELLKNPQEGPDSFKDTEAGENSADKNNSDSDSGGYNPIQISKRLSTMAYGLGQSMAGWILGGALQKETVPEISDDDLQKVLEDLETMFDDFDFVITL
ncbi:hypothetical protein HK100_002391 [Physocladia obscura]|uniref:Uncharacterized protein n=1 Tax=Physocladia obscura TaxID=109957 RepID=A0AAD5SY30_9FUNG|nr:hypothetical protein HK100_002391 [Physocladia obscura]